MDILLSFATACLDVLLESAPYILFGFFIAGLLKGLVPDDFVARHLGAGRKSGIVKAAVLGVPLPLCSCGVLPAAAGLRRQGSGKGATASFLVSTPETGVDSIAVTYALLDPVMTVIRPFSAFFTAMVAGFGIHFLDREQETASPGQADSAKDEKAGEQIRPAASVSTAPESTEACCGGSCTCSSDTQHSHPVGEQRVVDKIKSGLGFAFGDLLGDIGGSFLLGVLIAGGITTLLPDTFFTEFLGAGFLSMLVMLGVSVPLYVCATMSTPIAAALAFKGLAPGAVLVFLLAGPATNAAALTVISTILGRRSMMIYLAAVAFSSLAIGALVNTMYPLLGIDVSAWVQSGVEESHGIVAWISVAVLLAMIIRLKALRLIHGHSHDHAHGGCGCSGSSCNHS